jgi:hypothetical protein
MLDHLGSLGLLPEGLGQTPIQDHGVFGSGAGALDSAGDILGFTEVFLREAAALAVFPSPQGQIIIGAPINGLGFESLHVAPFMVAQLFRA